MKRRSLLLLLALGIGLGTIAGSGLYAGNEPPLQIIANQQAGQASPMAGNIRGHQPAPELHDIRGPVALPDDPNITAWLLIALGIMTLTGLLLFLRKRRKKEELPPLPHEIALAGLDRLHPMMNAAQAQLYAEGLAEILRRYLEARFLLPSTRQTTREFFVDLSNNALTGKNLAPHHERLRNCLEQCDLSKFAHYRPGRQTLESMEQEMRDFIVTTAQPRPEQGKR